jgi:phosphatidylglycerol:prolipoprotein diacylglycerol transferase
VHPVLFHIGALFIPSYGALAAAGVLLTLVLAQRTARIVGVSPSHVWNVCVVALFAALVGSRLLLAALNWEELLRHPLWILGLATIHSPVLAVAGVMMGAVAALFYMGRERMPWAATLDALAPALVVGLACEQWGALLAGAGYGTETSVGWAITYSDPLAQRWSGTPLGIALHPVQAYAAFGYMLLAVLLLTRLRARRHPGDVAGMALMGVGVVVYLTELWRDPEGRGQVLHGFFDGPQLAAIVMVVAGGMVLLQREDPAKGRGLPPLRQDKVARMGVARMGHETFEEPLADSPVADSPGPRDEAAHE